MQSRFNMLAVNNALKDICGSNQAFAGKVVVFCGDFRQTLLVVPGGSAGDIIGKTLSSLAFWPDVIVLYLTQNIRLKNPNLSAQGKRDTADFAKNLLKIGNNETTVYNERIQHDIAP